MMHGLAAEGDRHLDVAAPVQVQVVAGGLDSSTMRRCSSSGVSTSSIGISASGSQPCFWMRMSLTRAAVWPEFHRDVLDLAKAVALVEDVDGFHVFFSLKGDAWADCPRRCCF